MRRLRRLIAGALLLGIAGYVIWDWIESRGLAADIAQIAARGEPTVPIDREAAVLTGEQRDAARIYAPAVERMREAPPDEAFQYRQLDVDNLANAPVQLHQQPERPDLRGATDPIVGAILAGADRETRDQGLKD